MKLIRFGKRGLEKPGVLLGEKRKDCSGFFDDWNRDFFCNDGLNELQRLLENEGDTLPNVPKSERWAACISRPGMILCIGLNYADHAAESGMALPAEPVLFMKAANTINGPNDSIKIPKNSRKTDWEVELGLVLGKDACYLKSKEEAEGCIAGYCVVHDVSEREFQLEKSGQWVKGKSCPGFSPVGPYLVTKDEIPDVLNLKMQLSVNGKTRQKGNTKTMVFSPNHLVWYISQFMQLEAGDLISTGTPPGVGLGMNPPFYLKKGDVVELSVESLGRQKQQFI